ncbi:ABC transporter ATP-binding protein [Actinopolyspora mortivallis]|uniref:Dipeptide/oligopeptide/nickel ABC transporter ATP-binding protein n=1 Tax=Actinopolyspora mortivallis TaxID=33906 RepID=A0A2T0GWZ7_ACTMO|nr:ABC transporter ATP-binding protein [Actinopolyspora mortivallis]PRW63636.1 dipeptide/oligopeptide/nickel ABC transporter ATP-binding protein [Actinopolyspora mortivallis]
MSTFEVRDLVKEFRLHERGGRRRLRAVDGVSFDLSAGSTVALVGESGSGKSTLARMLARLLPPSSGEVRVDGRAVGTGRRATRGYRGDVQMVFQDPFASLNPFHTVGHHLSRPLRLHSGRLSSSELNERVERLLERVALVPPERVIGKQPHELSGGQRQRVAIARALAPGPRVLLADEPVSMLDVSVRLDILNLMDRLKAEEDLAVLYITHDLATARHFSERVLVMYRGQVVERGDSDEVILRPRHPYTRLLRSAAPDPGGSDPLTVPAEPASTEVPDGDQGCPFRARCPHAMPVCSRRPPEFPVGGGHLTSCWLYESSTEENT